MCVCVKMVCDKDAVCKCETHPSPISTTPATQNEGRCHQVPRLPRETTADVTKCHACHAKWRGVTRRHAASRRDQARHQSQPSPISTTPATQNEGGCHQVPRLPRETTADVAKCHACHVKRRRMSRSATPATQKGRGTARRPSASPDPAQSHMYHACHAKRRWMLPSATPPT